MSSVNPEHPFFQDEFYFRGKPGSYVYQESNNFKVRLIHQLVLASVGIPLCCFVFFLILRKTPARYGPYKKMFLLTSAVDAYILAECLFFQPVSFLMQYLTECSCTIC
jgi:hypothetical protein